MCCAAGDAVRHFPFCNHGTLFGTKKSTACNPCRIHICFLSGPRIYPANGRFSLGAFVGALLNERMVLNSLHRSLRCCMACLWAGHSAKRWQRWKVDFTANKNEAGLPQDRMILELIERLNTASGRLPVHCTSILTSTQIDSGSDT